MTESKFIYRAFYGVALAAVFLIPLGFIPRFGRLSTGQTFLFEVLALCVIPVCLVGGVGYLITRGQAMKPAMRLALLDVLMIAWAGIHVVSAVASPWPEVSHATFQSAVLVVYFLWRIIFTAFLVEAKSDEQGWLVFHKYFIRPFALLEVVLCVHILVSLIGGNPLTFINQSLDDTDARSTFVTLLGHTNYLASTLVLLFFLKLQSLFELSRSMLFAGERETLAGIALLNIITIYLVGARGATLAILVGGLVLVGFYSFGQAFKSKHKKIIIGAAGCIGLFVLVTLGLSINYYQSKKGKAIEGRSSVASRLFSRREVTTRLQSYLAASALALEHPVLGVGPGSAFDAAYWDLVQRQLVANPGGHPQSVYLGVNPPTLPTKPASGSLVVHPLFIIQQNGTSHGHTHNEWLHALTTSGILGFIVIVAITLTALRLTINLKYYFLTAGIVAFIIDSQFNFPLHLPISAIIIAALLAYLSGITVSVKQKKTAGVLWVVVIIIISLVLLFVYSGRLIAEWKSYGYYQQAGTEKSSDDMLNNLTKAVELRPDNIVARRRLIDAQLSRGRIHRAQTEAQAALKILPHPMEWFRLAETRLQDGKDREAAELFTLAYRMMPRHRESAERRVLAQFRVYQQIPDQAPMKQAVTTSILSSVNDLRTIDYDHPLGYFIEGFLAKEFGNVNTAAKHFRSVQRAVETQDKNESDQNDLIDAALLDTLNQLASDELDKLIPMLQAENINK